MAHVKETYYFSHDSNASRDPKMLEMRAIYGAEGYGWYWMIIEMMREQADFKLELCKRNALAMHLQCDPDAAHSFVQDCINEFGLFDADDEYFWSNSLLRRMGKVKAKSEKARQAALKRWEKIETCKRNANALQTHSDRNASKVKESKVKESKGTPPVVPPKAEEKKRLDGDGNVNESLKKIYDAFSENIHPITPFEAEGLAEWVDEGMEPGVIVWAIRQAVHYGKRNLKYIQGILGSLKAEGITTVAGAEARERSRADVKRQEPGAPRAREPTKPTPEEKKKLKELTRLLAEKSSLDAALDEKPEEEVPPWEQEQPRKRA